jgi:hypothetical protein
MNALTETSRSPVSCSCTRVEWDNLKRLLCKRLALGGGKRQSQKAIVCLQSTGVGLLRD